LMSSNSSQRYDHSLSTSISSQLHRNCPCTLFPRRLSFVFCAARSFNCIVPLCNSVLRLLAVCYIAELVVCWYILTICINGCSLLSAYSFSFVISTAWASSFKSSFSPSIMGHVGDLYLPLGDVFHRWLSVFLFLFPVFTVLLGTSNSKTVSKYWYCQWSNC
jgi:hypothetical protein